jgi:hypothetical protein
MSLRRLIPVLSVVVFASGSAALAQNKAPAPAPTPAPPAAGSGSGSGSAAAPADGSAVQPIEDAPPGDMEGRDENPDAPHGTGDDTTGVVATPKMMKPAGYPLEQSQRPITLPANMAEVSIGPHFQVNPYAGTDALRARYGITKQIQFGLTYVMGGVYDQPTTNMKRDYGFHVGKAAGVDVTVLLTNWLAVRGGVPVYFDPFAVSFAAGAPMKFILNEKLAIGGLEDVMNIRIKRFPPSFYQELFNAQGAANEINGSQQSRGRLRFSGFVEYQQNPKMALLGRVGLETDLGAGSSGAAGTATASDTVTFIRAGVQYSPKKYLDVGGTLGFDDLSKAGSFGLAGILAVRI